MGKGTTLAAALVMLATSMSAVEALADEPLKSDPNGERVTDVAKPLAGKPGSFSVGGFVLRPTLEIRTRAEVWSDAPMSVSPSAVLAETPLLTSHARDALIAERVRLGLSVEKGPLTATLRLEDVRTFGEAPSAFAGTHDLPYTAPYEAFLELHTSDRSVFFRAGRQEIVLGDGRLIGKSEDSPKGRSLDALRLGVRVRDFDLQTFAAMLAPPGQVSDTATNAPVTDGHATLKPGAQLYVVDATWHIKPFFKTELTGLARIVREPYPDELTPSDAFVGAVRFFGDYRGFRYSVIGAFEGGRVAIVDDKRTLISGGVAGRAEWETALPWHVTFGAQGAYASGSDRSNDNGTDHTFDPILPDSDVHFGQAGFYGWTNLIEAGGDVGIQPVDPMRLRAGYRFVGLADEKGTWFSSVLEPVGTNTANTSKTLGHVIEGTLTVTPWDPLHLIADYAAMILGDGGKAILDPTGGRKGSVIHYGLIEAQLTLP